MERSSTRASRVGLMGVRGLGGAGVTWCRRGDCGEGQRVSDAFWCNLGEYVNAWATSNYNQKLVMGSTHGPPNIIR